MILMARNDFGRGLGDAIEELLGGIVIVIFSIAINAISATGLLPSGFMQLFELINIVALASLLFGFQKAGYAYLIGWIFGMFVMVPSGLLGFWDVVLYVGVPILIIAIRVYTWSQNQDLGSYI